jgi:tetratricopeptide (TPR) repeat protein
MKAQALAHLGRWKEATLLDESVLRSAPSYEQALDECVLYSIELGDIEAALAPARQAVAVNPWCAVLHERLAYLYVQRQDWSGALRESGEALRLNPFLRFARMFVVQCLLHENDRKRAQDEFVILTELNPTQRESLIRWFAEQRRSDAR